MLPFLAATLLSALLLFEVQPLVARAILPGFGGSPAVWTTCMLFFQLLLVAGYGYGHLLIGRFNPKAQARIHLALIAASLVVLGLTALAFGTPLLPPRAAHIGASPQLAILGRLALAVGAPYLVLSTTGPLVQALWGRTFQGSSPYRLYALSNLGSLVGLISYPLALEPLLGLRAQALAWTGGYILFALCMIAVTQRAARAAPAGLPVEPGLATPRPRLRQQLAWLSLAAIASTLLLAVTNQLCQEVASIPLLWVLPLGLYLLSFIFAFDAPRWYPRALWMPLFLAAAAAAVYFLQRPRLPLPWQIAVWSSVLLTGCMVCHGELSRARPPARYLTGFYLIVACGGASGGIFVALLAPLLFSSYVEVQLALGAGVLAAGAALLADRGGALHTGPRWRLSTSRLALGLLVGGLIVGLGQTLFSSTGLIVSRSRSFFGVLKVSESFRGDPVRDRLVLTHGRTYHGIQLTSQEGRLQPTTYYEEQSGIGRAIRLHPRRAQGLKIGMCGLGVGTVAAYLRPTDQLRIYEIDPSVIALSASPEGVFRYVPEARGPVEVVLGDARVSLEEELVRGGNSYDVLAVDAFSGDAIPVHLLTREALTLYLKHLAPEGVLALHVTNAHLDLVPVVEAVAASLNLSAGLVDTDYDYDDDSVDWDSTWVLVARSAAALAPFGPFDEDEDAPQAPVRPWTDDYSNVVGALRF